MIAAVLVASAVVSGLIGLAIGSPKGRGTEGFLLSALLGFIGWIIVASMSPSVEHEAQRLQSIASAIRADDTEVTRASGGPTRECPWCAETIKAAARLCRFCGREIEPLTTEELAQQEDDDFDRVRAQYPTEFETAYPYLQRMTSPPHRPAAWLAELCKRISYGSPPAAAAGKIPLDWSGPTPPSPRPAALLVGMGNPDDVGDFPEVAKSYWTSYNTARAVMAGLDTPPAYPEAWLRELCKRMNAGSPPQTAAERIPLDWR